MFGLFDYDYSIIFTYFAVILIFIVETGEGVADSSTPDNVQEDEYLVPTSVQRGESWPEETPPPAPSSPSNNTTTSDTLNSITSNVYEDMLSSENEDDNSSSDGNSNEDLYSDVFDETFDNEDDAKGSTSMC